KDARGEDAGYGDGEDDADHGPEARGPVDARALLQLLGDGLEVAHEEPGAEGDEEGRVRQDQGPRGVAELEGPDDVGERDEEQGGRHEVGHEDGRADGARHGELEPAEGIAGGEATEERE